MLSIHSNTLEDDNGLRGADYITMNHPRDSSGTGPVPAPRKRSYDNAELDGATCQEVARPAKIQHLDYHTTEEDKVLNDTKVSISQENILDCKVSPEVSNAQPSCESPQVKSSTPGGDSTTRSTSKELGKETSSERHTLLTCKINDVILHSSKIPSVPHVILSLPEETNSEHVYEENATPVQDCKYGDALVVLSLDRSRIMEYIGLSQQKDENPSDFLDFSSIEDDSHSSDTDTDEYESWDYYYKSSRPESPVPFETTFYNPSDDYDDFPASSTDLGYMSEPGHVSTYEFIEWVDTEKEDDEDDIDAYLEHFFNDAAE